MRPAGTEHTPSFRFHHLDYSTDLPIGDGTIDVLVSLYAGFITESCTRYLTPGGLILVNNSHGDASMATLDDDNELVAAVQSRDGDYRIDTTNLADYLKPKRGQPPTAEELHNTNRGVAFTKPAFAYVFANRRAASI